MSSCNLCASLLSRTEKIEDIVEPALPLGARRCIYAPVLAETSDYGRILRSFGVHSERSHFNIEHTCVT